MNLLRLKEQKILTGRFNADNTDEFNAAYSDFYLCA
jgi:hypothetical protein